MQREEIKKRYRWLSLFILILCGGNMGNVQALQTIDTRVQISVSVTSLPCVVNNNQQIDINFGDDVIITKIDGYYKKMPVVYSVECKGGMSTPQIAISGIGASFDANMLKTNNDDLAVAFMQENMPFPINQWASFNATSKLTAVLRKRDGVRLSSGAFDAWATMMVEYR